MPGFTHLQVAQPVTFGHHLLAYVEMFARDAERMRRRAASASNRLPLGAAALAGTSYPIDRERGRARRWASTACARTRSTRCRDRDFAIEFCAGGGARDDARVALLARSSCCG